MSRLDYKDDRDLMEQLAQLIDYAKDCWSSKVKLEWQVTVDDYLRILPEVIADWTKGASADRKFVRIAGPSGSGKTSQLLPAVEAWYGEGRPILVAARKLVQFHPFAEAILAEYGEKNLRKMTDEFASVMLFLVLRELIYGGYDIILDVAFLDKKFEKFLLGWLQERKYTVWATMVVVSPKITARWLGRRAWRHSKTTEEEFWRVMEETMSFYIETCPDMRIVLWSAWDLDPVYDGKLSGAFDIWRKYLKIDEIKDGDEDALRKAKVRYLRCES